MSIPFQTKYQPGIDFNELTKINSTEEKLP